MSARPLSASGAPRRDPVHVLTAVRPVAGEGVWPAADQDSVLGRILATPRGGSAQGRQPASPPPRLRHPRRAAVVSLAALTLVGGAGAAAAAGLVPRAFTDAFSGWLAWHDPSASGGDHPVDPAAARRVATAPGPQGTAFTVVAARAADDPGHVCLDALYESPDSTSQRLPADFEDVLGDRCLDTLGRGALGAAAEGSVVRAASAVDRGLGLTQDTLVWSMAAGGAVRASVHTADGQTRSAVVFDGQLFGWVPLHGDQAPSATITAYDGHDAVIGRVDLYGDPAS